MPKAADRLIKLAYLEMINKEGNVKINKVIEELNALDAKAFQRLQLEKAREWKEAA
jgi:hypothetical protein